MKLVVFALFAALCRANGESCTTPAGTEGNCKVIYDCEILRTLASNPNATSQDLDTLRESHCGFDGPTPKVCCPLMCTTLEGRPGTCVDINSCPRVHNMMKQQASEVDQPLNQTTSCKGPGQLRVCCSSTDIEPITRFHCSTRNTVYPPDPSTRCCGMSTVARNRIGIRTDPEIDLYPWLALIEYISKGQTLLLCGGTLISNRHVLTAAHCVTGKALDRGTPTSVRLGEHDISNDGVDCVTVYADAQDCAEPIVTVPIETIIVHEDFTPKSLLNDIAIIKLQDSAPYTDFIRPLCLPTEDVVSEPRLRYKLTLAGWDLETSGKTNSAKQDQYLSYVSLDRCREAYSNRTTLWDRQICATGERRRTCIGGLGWPLTQEGLTSELIGIASFGVNSCLDDHPVVYTKVFSYLDWIRSKVVL